MNAQQTKLQPESGASTSRYAFSRSCRLTKTDEFSSVFGFRKALKSSHFLLHYRIRENEQESGARLGLVVAKRLLRKAVDRNLVRRVARENFRLLRLRLPARDFVLRLANRPALLERTQLAEEIQGLLKKMCVPGR